MKIFNAILVTRNELVTILGAESITDYKFNGKVVKYIMVGNYMHNKAVQQLVSYYELNLNQHEIFQLKRIK